MMSVIVLVDVYSNRPETAKPMSKAPEGEGCPRCGGHVYAAETMLARGRVYTTIYTYIYIHQSCCTSLVT